MVETRTSDLLGAAGAGDQAAFVALVRSQGPRLYAIALRVTRDDALAEDVVQETFLKILRGQGSIRSAAAAEAWLARVATRLAIDLLRSRDARRRREEDYAMARQGADDRPEEKAIGMERSAVVAEALGLVPAEARAAIWLHIVEGQTVREVGTCLGIAPSSVMDRIRDGMEQIRRFLKRKGLLALAALPPGEILRGLPDPVPPPELLARIESLGTTRGPGVADAGRASAAPGSSAPAAAKVLASIGLGLVLIGGTVIAWKLRSAGIPADETPPRGFAAATLPSIQGTKTDEVREATGISLPSTTDPAVGTRPVLTVRVVDEEGKSVTRAQVMISWFERFDPGEEVFRLPSDLLAARRQNMSWDIRLDPSPSGEFVWRERMGSRVLIVAASPVHRSTTKALEVPEAGLHDPAVVVLRRGDLFSGRVVDTGNGDASIQGARIGIGDRIAPGPRVEFREPPQVLFPSVTTGPDGRFEITGSEGDIWVSKEGYGPTVFAMDPRKPWDESEHRVPLLPPTRLHISVRTSDGLPVPSFEYLLAEEEPQEPRWKDRRIEGFEADLPVAHHAYISGGQTLLHERTILSVRAELPPAACGGANASAVKMVDLEYGSENRVEIVVISRGAVVVGRALDPDGQPVAGAHLFAASEKSPVSLSPHDPVGGNRTKPVETDAMGRFRLPVDPGHVAVVAIREGFSAYVSEAMVVLEGQEVRIDIRFPGPPARISGRIAEEFPDRAGRSVWLEPVFGSDFPPGVGLPHHVVTDPQGAFAFEDLPPGVYEVMKEGYPVERVMVSIRPGESHEVILGRKGSGGINLQGRVVEDGKPLAGLCLNLHVEPSSRPVTVVKTGADGSFTMEGIPPGRHTIAFTVPRRGIFEPRIDVSPGMGPIEIDASGRSIEGIVRSADGPVPDVSIQVLVEMSAGGWAGATTFRSDGTGRFRIDGLYPTRYILVFRKEDYLARSIPMDLADPNGIAAQEVLLEKTGGRGKVRFVVSDSETGNLVEEAGAVVLADEEGAIFSIGRVEPRGNGGRLEIDGLPSGKYRAEIYGLRDRLGDPLSLHAAEFVDFEHQAGIDQEIPVRLRPGGALSIRVSTHDGSVPAASSVEVISPEGAPVSIDLKSRKATVSRFRGSIRLYGLPAGDCRVRVGSEGRDPVEKGVKIEPGRTAAIVVEDWVR